MCEKNNIETDYTTWMKYIIEKYCQDLIKLHGDTEGMKQFQQFKQTLLDETNKLLQEGR